jgi:nicotinamidase/pyrazinamidase
MAEFIDTTSPGEKTILLIIDPQNDFHAGGSLAVAGAVEDSERTASFIRANLSKIDEIYVSLDTHHKLHIAHGAFWRNSAGESPAPFTLIKHQDVLDGLWTPRVESNLEWAKTYTKALEDKGRFILIIWPEHCLIGTHGHNVFPCVNEALQEWARENLKTVQYVLKGENCFTEMYSAVSAEVPVNGDGMFNKALFDGVTVNTKQLIVCGQALSHCVNFTLRDIFNRLVETGRSTTFISLLVDAASPVTGFEDAGRQFVEDMRAGGVNITTTTDLSL